MTFTHNVPWRGMSIIRCNDITVECVLTYILYIYIPNEAYSGISQRRGNECNFLKPYYK